MYRYYNLRIASNLPIPELLALTNHQELADWEIHLTEVPPRELGSGEWTYHWPGGDNIQSLTVAKTKEGFVVRIQDLADFIIFASESQIKMWPAPATNSESLRHLLLDQVLPRLLAQQGRLVLHAGAVHANGIAIAFVGTTGSGKSTLTGSFHAAGYPLLSDDALVLSLANGHALAQATYPSLRLWPDAINGIFTEAPASAPLAHFSAKRRVLVCETTETANQPMPLAALYVLAPAAGGVITLRPLSQRDACIAIISHSFQLDVSDHRRAAGMLDAAAAIAQHLPAFELSFPRNFASLTATRAAILEHSQQWTAPLGVPASA